MRSFLVICCVGLCTAVVALASPSAGEDCSDSADTYGLLPNPHTPHSDVVAFMHTDTAADSHTSTAQVPGWDSLPLFHLTAYFGSGFHSAPLGLMHAATGKRVQLDDIPVGERPRELFPFVGASFSYNITPRLLSVLSVAGFPAVEIQESTDGVLLNKREMWGWTFALGGAINLLTADQLHDLPVEWQIGAGVAHTSVFVRTALSRNGQVMSDMGTESDALISATVFTSVQYFLSREFSISMLGEFIPSGEMSIRGQVYEYKNRQVEPVGRSFNVAVTTQRLNLALGIGIHF